MSKPNPLIYALTCERLGLQPSEVIQTLWFSFLPKGHPQLLLSRSWKLIYGEPQPLGQ